MRGVDGYIYIAAFALDIQRIRTTVDTDNQR